LRFSIAMRRTWAAWSAICRTELPSGKMIFSTGSGAAPALWAQTTATIVAKRSLRKVSKGYFRLHSAAVSKVCASCGKKPSFGNNRSHSMVATKRRFNPNLQRVRVLLNGVAKRAYICTKCLKAGKVQKAV
jgi:large subunit ribosomal protein L28